MRWDDGEAVDEMIRKARNLMDDAVQKYDPIAIFAGFSGGNDSIVATHFACENYGATAIHCNTMIGIEKSRNHARRTAEKFGWDFSEKKAMAYGPPARMKDGSAWDPEKLLPHKKWVEGETAYEEFCYNFGMPGPGMHPRMYRILKERTFDTFKREAKSGKPRSSNVMFVTGIRHDESARRAGYQKAVHKIGASVWVSPFYWSTKIDFELYRQEFGLPRNPVTDVIGISGECLCGTFGSPQELDLLDAIEPETKAYVKGIEFVCSTIGLHDKWATRPPKETSCGVLDLTFGTAPSFQPACVGCARRKVVT